MLYGGEDTEAISTGTAQGASVPLQNGYPSWATTSTPGITPLPLLTPEPV